MPHHWSFKVLLLFHFPLRLKSHGTPRPGNTLFNEHLWPGMRFCVVLNSVKFGVCFYLHRWFAMPSFLLVILTSCSLAYFFPLDIMSAGRNSCKNSWQLLTVVVYTPQRTHLCSSDGHSGVLPLPPSHTFPDMSYTQVECWVTIYIMKKTDIENRLVNTAGEGEVEMKWESRIEAYTLPYVKQIANGKSTKELILSNWCWRRLLRVPWTARRSN